MFNILTQRKGDIGAMAAVLLLLAVVLPLWLDPFRLNLVSKYLAFAFVAIGVVLTVLIIVVTAIQFQLSKRYVFYG